MMKENLKKLFCKHNWIENWIYSDSHQLKKIHKFKRFRCTRCKKTKHDFTEVELTDLEMKLFLTLNIDSHQHLIDVSKEMLKKFDGIK